MSLFFLVILCLWLFIGNNLYGSLFLRKKANKKWMSLGAETDMLVKRELDKSFRTLKGLHDFEEVNIESKDHIKLHAYHLLGSADHFVILCHDYVKDAKQMSLLAEYYLSKGYHIFMIDARGNGYSGSKKFSLGLHEREDLNAWIFYIMSRHPHAKILLHGIGMGAFTLLLDSHRYPRTVTSIICDSAYTNLYDIFYEQLKCHFGILAPIMFASFNLVTRVRSGFSFKDLSVVPSLRKNKIPVLFIHGKEDEIVPSSMTETLYLICTSEKKICLLKGEHGIASMKDTEAYFRNVAVFLEKYMG